jgi:hypothetical protein
VTDKSDTETMFAIASRFFDHISVDKDDNGHVTRILMWKSEAWGDNDPLEGNLSEKN